MRNRNIIFTLLIAVITVLCINFSAEAKKGGYVEGVVNINNASIEELKMIPGIGPSKASAIIDFRTNQRFETTEDIMKVKGVGQKLYDKIQAYITVDGPTTAKVSNTSINLDTPTAGEEG